MTYLVQSVSCATLTEGRYVGRPAVVLRFGSRDQDCEHYEPEDLVSMVRSLWPVWADVTERLVVCTGVEPWRQVDEELIDRLHERHYTVAVRTAKQDHIEALS